MPVVAVVNQKGGCGKSTLATHIAAWCAQQGWRVMLGDIDRQQSIRSWLDRRSQSLPEVRTWAMDNGKVFRAPKGTTHVVLDTPGGLHGHELAKLIMWVDAVVVPVGPSVFDRDSTAMFLQALYALPKVKSGRCLVGLVGMRWSDEVDRQANLNVQWLPDQSAPLLTVIREAPIYELSLEQGKSFFDMPPSEHETERQDWKPLLLWLLDIFTESRYQEQTLAETNQKMRLAAASAQAHSKFTNPAAVAANFESNLVADRAVPAMLRQQTAQSTPRVLSHETLDKAFKPFSTGIGLKRPAVTEQSNQGSLQADARFFSTSNAARAERMNGHPASTAAYQSELQFRTPVEQAIHAAPEVASQMAASVPTPDMPQVRVPEVEMQQPVVARPIRSPVIPAESAFSIQQPQAAIVLPTEQPIKNMNLTDAPSLPRIDTTAPHYHYPHAEGHGSRPNGSNDFQGANDSHPLNGAHGNGYNNGTGHDANYQHTDAHIQDDHHAMNGRQGASYTNGHHDSQRQHASYGENNNYEERQVADKLTASQTGQRTTWMSRLFRRN